MSSYGDWKRRDIARSALQSKMTGAKRSKRIVHKSERSRVRDSLRTGISPLSAEDAFDGDGDAYWYPSHKVKYIVRDRRDSDRLSSLLRWAERVTADIEPDERMDYLRSILPGDKAGRHALSHLEDHYGERHAERVYWDEFRRASREAFLASRLAKEEALAALLRQVVERGYLKAFNLNYKDGYVWNGYRLEHIECRSLHGYSDVEDFIAFHVRRYPTYNVHRRLDEIIGYARALLG